MNWKMNPMGKHRVFFTFILLINLHVHNTMSETRETRGILFQPLNENEEMSEANIKNFPSTSSTQVHVVTTTDNGGSGSEPLGNQKSSDDRISDTADAALPEELNYFQDNGISPESRKHLLSKRQVQNDYERFYLCLFTLFTNPRCQQQVDASLNGGNYAFDNAASNNAYIPVVQPQRQGQGFMGLGIGQGLFGNRFNDNSNFNNFNTNFQQQQPQLSQPQLGGEYFPIVQSPYPDPQVNRRPGPESIQQSIVPQANFEILTPTSTSATLTTTTTTTNPSTTTETVQSASSENKESFISSSTSSTFSIENFSVNKQSTTPRPSDLNENTDNGPDVANCNNKTESNVKPTSVTLLRPPHLALAPSNLEQSDEDPFIIFEEKFNAVTKLEEENRLLKSQAAATSKQLESYLVQTKYLQEALANAQEDNSKTKQRVSQLERTNNHLQSQNGQLQHLTGDQKTQINQFTNRMKYLEDKLVRLSGQNLPLTREVERHQQVEKGLQDKIRRLTKENSECRNQIYQIQLRHTQRLVQDTPKREKEASSQDEKYTGLRDDLLTRRSSTEELSDDTTIVSAETSSETTINPEDLFTNPETTFSSEFISNFETTIKPTFNQINFNDIPSSTPGPELSSSSIPTPTTTLPVSPSPAAIAETVKPSSMSTSTPLPPTIIFDDTPGDEYALSDRNIFGLGSYAPDSNFNINSDDNNNNNQFYPYALNDNQNQYNNVWNLPLFSTLFDRRQNTGYGQNQGYYRTL